MRRIILYMITTVDGFIADPDGDLDWYDPSDEEMRFANELFGEAGGILFGRTAYEGFAAYWDPLAATAGDGRRRLAEPKPTRLEAEFAGIFRNLPRHVVSRTLAPAEGGAVLAGDGRAVLVAGDVPAQVAALKRQPGRDLLLICGPELLATLIPHDLVDEYRLLVVPVVLGQGRPLFERIQDRLRLELRDSRVFDSGVVALRYQPARAA
jgi:dihydrofolate reductase